MNVSSALHQAKAWCFAITFARVLGGGETCRPLPSLLLAFLLKNFLSVCIFRTLKKFWTLLIFLILLCWGVLGWRVVVVEGFRLERSCMLIYMLLNIFYVFFRTLKNFWTLLNF